MNKISADKILNEKTIEENKLSSKEYRYGFYTDIETDTIAKGLNEEVILIISKKYDIISSMNINFWKNYPYWIKGGIIGGAVTLVFIVLFYSCTLLPVKYSWYCLIPLVFSPMFPFAILIDSNPFFHTLPEIFLPIFMLNEAPDFH